MFIFYQILHHVFIVEQSHIMLSIYKLGLQNGGDVGKLKSSLNIRSAIQGIQQNHCRPSPELCDNTVFSNRINIQGLQYHLQYR